MTKTSRPPTSGTTLSFSSNIRFACFLGIVDEITQKITKGIDFVGMICHESQSLLLVFDYDLFIRLVFLNIAGALEPCSYL